VRVIFDTNILVYAFDADAGPRHDQAMDLVTRASTSDCVLALQTLGELFHAGTRKRILSVTDALLVLDRLQRNLPVCAADQSTLKVAIEAFRQHRLPFWDAMLWATVQQAGCRLLLTEDLQDGRTLGSVTFVNSFDPSNDELLARAMAPPGA
jgi:predicted nucleic acid-binding protein